MHLRAEGGGLSVVLRQSGAVCGRGYLDQPIEIWLLTATSESPSADCITPRYLNCRTFDSSALLYVREDLHFVIFLEKQ